MRLSEIARGDRALLYLERYVDEGAKSYSPFAARNEASAAFQPRAGLADFELIAVRTPKERLAIFEADPARSLRERFIRPEEALFVVHPETWADSGVEHLDELRALPRGEPIIAAPT